MESYLLALSAFVFKRLKNPLALISDNKSQTLSAFIGQAAAEEQFHGSTTN